MNYLIFGGVLASLLSVAYSISCHQCQTMANKECSDPYIDPDRDDLFLGDCDDDHYCTKWKTIVYLRDSGYIDGWQRHSVVVTRSCEPRQGKKEGCIGWQNNGGITLKCWCGTDGCNSGRTLIPTTTAIVFSCLVSLFVFVRLH